MAVQIFPKYKAFFFDLGGVVLTDGLDMFVKILSQRYNKPPSEIREVFDGHLGTLYREAKITRDEFWRQAVSQLGLKENINRLSQEWINCYQLVPVMRRLIINLKKRYQLYYLSDIVEERVTALNQKFGFLNWFAGGVFGYEVGARKTKPRIFKKALEKARLRAEEIVFVDDKERNIKMAQSLGMRAFLFVTPEELLEDFRRGGILADDEQ